MKKESFKDVSAKWTLQCIANPYEIIAKSGDYLVLYDTKRKKVVEYKRLDELKI